MAKSLKFMSNDKYIVNNVHHFNFTGSRPTKQFTHPTIPQFDCSHILGLPVVLEGAYYQYHPIKSNLGYIWFQLFKFLQEFAPGL